MKDAAIQFFLGSEPPLSSVAWSFPAPWCFCLGLWHFYIKVIKHPECRNLPFPVYAKRQLCTCAVQENICLFFSNFLLRELEIKDCSALSRSLPVTEVVEHETQNKVVNLEIKAWLSPSALFTSSPSLFSLPCLSQCSFSTGDFS